MEKPELQWTTTHTAEHMTHDFGNGYKIIVDKKLNTAYKMKDQEVKDTFSTTGMLLESYTQIVSNFAKSIIQ